MNIQIKSRLDHLWHMHMRLGGVDTYDHVHSYSIRIYHAQLASNQRQVSGCSPQSYDQVRQHNVACTVEVRFQFLLLVI